jgi:hypothetical protein
MKTKNLFSYKILILFTIICICNQNHIKCDDKLNNTIQMISNYNFNNHTEITDYQNESRTIQ